MKKLIPITLLILIVLSCEKESLVTDLTIDQILNGKDVTVHKGMLTFKDTKSFDSFVKDLTLKPNSELEQWEKTNNFKSLATIHEEVIVKEEDFLNAMNIKYNGNENVTRKDIGYTQEAQNLIDKGLLVVNEYETLDLNIPVHFYGRLLNRDGILRIGNEIHVPKIDFILVIKDGDISKVNKAKNYKPGDQLENGVQIARVEKRIESSSSTNSKVAATLSCDNVVGSYRLIVYDEYSYIFFNDGSFPCDNQYSNYNIRLRSLKKILGTWQNHSTSQWSLRSNLIVDHMGRCFDNSGSSTDYFVQNIVTYNNTTFTPPFDHTWVQQLYANYHSGPCESGGLGSCPDGSNPQAWIRFPIRQHNATGKNGTICYVGA